jgi:hypothetical protein
MYVSALGNYISMPTVGRWYSCVAKCFLCSVSVLAIDIL